MLSALQLHLLPPTCPGSHTECAYVIAITNNNNYVLLQIIHTFSVATEKYIWLAVYAYMLRTQVCEESYVHVDWSAQQYLGGLKPYNNHILLL